MLITETMRTRLKSNLTNLGNELTTLAERKRQRALLEDKIKAYEDIVRVIKSEEQNLKQAKLFIIKYQNDKKLRDAELIHDSMAVASHLVLADRNIVPRFKTSNSSRPESHLVVEMDGRELLLNLTEGTGVQESISSLTGMAVLSSTPYIKTLLYDEHYSSISPTNTANFSKSLNALIDDKFQLILIEQKDEIVAHCSYRLFKVEREGSNSRIVTYDVDEEGNMTLIE